MELSKILLKIAVICIVVVWINLTYLSEKIILRFPLLRIADSEKDQWVKAFIVLKTMKEQDFSALPNLNQISWPTEETAELPAGRRDLTGSVVPLPKPFEPIMSKGQRKLYQTLLQIFSKLMFENGLGDRFFLQGGTLLGSYRHHEFIPWDEDIDLLVDLGVRPQVQTLLKKLKPDYLMHPTFGRDKLYARILNRSQDAEDLELSRSIPSYSWGWPFLDIGYYTMNDTHVIEIAKSYGRSYEYPREVVFPLLFRPFGRNWFPAPYHPLEFLRYSYPPTNLCSMSGYSHVLENQGPTGSVPCALLSSRYAFVQHSPCKKFNGKVRSNSQFLIAEERLVRNISATNEMLIHSICLPMHPKSACGQTYALRCKEHTEHLNSP